ncbi:MAG: hypothetical protein RhofKO_36660 [Rhodothermales bacterium]
MAATLIAQINQDRIREAVAEAELRTSGEIVPVVVPASDAYEVALWKGALSGGLVLLALVLTTAALYDGWGLAWAYSAWGSGVALAVGCLIGWVLTRSIPAIRRMMAGTDRMAMATHQRALVAFVEEEVFRTRDRTGILILLSIFEHRIEVLGDEGINQAVQADDWVAIVDHIRTGIQSGKVTDHLVEAIHMCGNLLETKGVEIKPDDTNELPDGLRIRKG